MRDGGLEERVLEELGDHRLSRMMMRRLVVLALEQVVEVVHAVWLLVLSQPFLVLSGSPSPFRVPYQQPSLVPYPYRSPSYPFPDVVQVQRT